MEIFNKKIDNSFLVNSINTKITDWIKFMPGMSGKK